MCWTVYTTWSNVAVEIISLSGHIRIKCIALAGLIFINSIINILSHVKIC